MRHRILKMSKMEYPTPCELPVSKQKGMGKKSIVAVFNMDNVNEKKNIIWPRTGDKEAVLCPKSVSDYDEHTRGTDHFHNLLA